MELKKYVLPRHSLDKTFTEMVIRNGHLHLLVSSVGVTMTQQHDLFYLFFYQPRLVLFIKIMITQTTK